ncbi:murein hydrolase activator EnvC family protein [Neptunomonas antarctica]|uniref:Septal ring factor EnvC, activator of murein hydrolases AmiA and AmiB n=1 Tax=Neptunomonas antarctica TaxID=619304 RepID=A0A1N7PNC3_9GAMM|nr:peptidoglycan DD-metalloendopeptidase family protein [Neptunomonas antarctica]SIT12082.1 Septal ring factor EnvC, activator of murein hydrolases AmiA and AmiB [Neptunomonas antarctica]
MYVAPEVFAAEQKATASQLDSLKKSIKQVNSALKRDQKKQSSAAKELATTEQEISGLGKLIYGLDQELSTLTVDLSGFQAEKSRLEQKLGESSERLGQLVRQQYRLGPQPRLFMLLNQRDPEQVSRMMKYYDRYSAAQAKEQKQYQTLLHQLTSTYLSIDTTQQAILENRDALKNKLATLEALRKQRKQTLTALDKQIHGSQKQLKQLQADQKRLEKLLSDIEKSISSANLTQNTKTFDSLKGKLDWPVKGKILRAYGSVKDNLSYDGVLLAGTTGGAVSAVHHGRVVFSDWLRGYGLLTIIDHGDGYMSLYGQNDSLLKETGDWVSQGESVATLGSSGGNSEPGLYFAIRYKGKAISPKRWFVGR